MGMGPNGPFTMARLRQFAGNHSGHDADCDRCAVAALLAERDEDWVHRDTFERAEESVQYWRGVAGALLTAMAMESYTLSKGVIDDSSADSVLHADGTYVGGEKHVIEFVDRSP